MYRNIQPPFTLKFRQMSKQELKDYFRWFAEAIPQRINELRDIVTSSPRFHGWEPDSTPDSLRALGDWFAANVEVRQRTPEELEELRHGSGYAIEPEGGELTNRTFSLAMDIGMYLSRVFLENHKSLHWEQPIGDKKFADYGQPVLVGFGEVPLNPVRVSITFAYGLARGTR